MTPITGLTPLDRIINTVGLSYSRYINSIQIPGIIIERSGSSRLLIQAGFSAGASPEVRSQTFVSNFDGSSPLIINNKKGVSNSCISRNKGITHWYQTIEWHDELDKGTSTDIKTFDVNTLGTSRVTLY